MMTVREFEFYEDEGCIVALPVDMEGGTFGADLQDAVQSAADWLHEAALASMMEGSPLPGGSVGNAPQHGGRVIPVAVCARLSDLNAVTAAEAARMLGVSGARVSQMCEAGSLESWRQGGNRMVTRRSIEERQRDKPGPGRPRKHEGGVGTAALLVTNQGAV